MTHLPDQNSKKIAKQIKRVCTASWSDIRVEALALARRGGLESLVDAYSLLTEAEARGKVPASDTTLDSLHAQLSRCGHPLSSVSARWSELEHGVPVRSITETDLGTLVGVDVPRGIQLPDGLAVPFEVGDAAPPEAIEAFSSMLTRSNGKAAAMSFFFESPTKATTGVNHAIRAAFEPARDASFAELTTPTCAVHSVLHDAIGGGAYDDGLGAAFGRVAAWTTIRWLAGTGPAAPHGQALADAASSEWIRFDGLGRWFEGRGVFDECLACINPDGERVACVAWTDTD